MTLLDTNYILRWFLGDVPEQSQVAAGLLESSKPDSLVVDRVIIAEVTYVLRGKGYSHSQITEVFEGMYAYPAVRSADSTDEMALTIYRQTSLDFEDCVLAALCKVRNYGLASFDQQLQKQLNRQTPT